MAKLARILLVTVPLVVAVAPTTSRATTWHWSRPYTVRDLGGGFAGLACPSAGECLAISGNELLWSTNLGAASSWQRVVLEPGSSPWVIGTVALEGVQCSSPTACLVADNVGDVFAAANPTGGATAWTMTSIASTEIVAFGCSSSLLCAAVDVNGATYASAAPGGGSWTQGSIGPPGSDGAAGASCAGTSLCAAVEDTAAIYHAAAPGSAWRGATLGGLPLDDVDCPTTRLCVAVGGYDSGRGGRISVSADPAGGAAAWRTTTVAAPSGLDHVACNGTSLCVAVGDTSIYLSTHPAARASAWRAYGIPRFGSDTAVSCPSRDECLVGTSTGQLSIGRSQLR